jgi:hypothetical protein
MVLAACQIVLLARPAAALESGVQPLLRELTSCINDGVDDQHTTYKDFAYKKPVRCVHARRRPVLGLGCLHISAA